MSRILAIAALLVACVAAGSVPGYSRNVSDVEADADVAQLRSKRAAQISVALKGQPATAYTVVMTFGPDKQKFECILDTGSSNLAVAGVASKGITNYYTGPTASTGKEDFSVQYVESSWTAERVMADVDFFDNNSPVVGSDVSFGLITSFDNFENECILGVGYEAIADPPKDPVKPFFQQLVNQGEIDDIFGLSLCDRNPSEGNGNMDVGFAAPDPNFGDVFYVPIVKPTYYTVLVSGMSVEGEDLGLDCGTYQGSGLSIVDSGTSDLYVPDAVFKLIAEKIRNYAGLQGSNIDIDSLLQGKSIKMTPVDVLKFPVLQVRLVAGENTELTLPVYPEHYLRVISNAPVTTPIQNTVFEYQLVIIGRCTINTGVTLGDVFMTNYYVIFDRENSRLGFQTTACITSQFYQAAGRGSYPPLTAPTAIKYPAGKSDLDSFCKSPDITCNNNGGDGSPSSDIKFPVWAIAIIAVSGVAVLVAMVYFVYWWTVPLRSPQYRAHNNNESIQSLFLHNESSTDGEVDFAYGAESPQHQCAYADDENYDDGYDGYDDDCDDSG